MTPFFSIITPVFNGADFIDQYIYALKSQKFVNWEAVIVDDASSDETLALLNAKTSSDPRFRIFSLLPSTSCDYSGPARPRNFALDKALGSYICFLDIDDFWLQTKLLHQHQYLQNHPSVKLLYGNYFKCNSTLDCGYLKPRLDLIPIKLQVKLFNPIPMLTSCIKSDFAIRHKFKYIGHEDYVYWHQIISELHPSEICKISVPSSLYRTSKTSFSSDKLKVLGWWLVCFQIIGHNLVFSLVLLLFRFLLELFEQSFVTLRILPHTKFKTSFK